MQRKFLRNLALLLVLNLLIKPFWIFGIDRTVQNTVGPEEYGFYFAIFNFSYLFYILLDFGITIFNNKNIAQNNQLLRKHLSNLIVVKLLLFFVYIVFVIGGAFTIQYSSRQIYLLLFLGINQFLVSFILYLRSNLGGLHLFRTDSIISVLDRGLMILICAVLLWGDVLEVFRIEYFVYAQTVSLLLTAVITLIIVLRKALIKSLRLNWNRPFIILMLRQSLPFALLVLLMTIYNRVDSVMLERMLPEGARFSGIYASAYRLLDAANMLPYLFAVLLLPIFARMLKQQESVEEILSLSYILIITPAIIIAMLSLFYSNEFMTLLYPIYEGESLQMYDDRIAHSARVFVMLMFSFTAIATMYIFSTLLTANGNLKHLNVIAFSGMIVNVMLNLLLIPNYQAVGSAAATLVTQLLIAVSQIWIASRLFRLHINYRLIGKLLLFVIGVFLLGLLTSRFLPVWYYGFFLLGTVSVLMAMAIGLLRPAYIYKMLKYGDNPQKP